MKNILTVCVPVYNESGYIDELLKSLVDAPPGEKEIILIDGGSTDDTVNRIGLWQKNHNNIRVIPNEMKYVSHGFNLAYKSSQSKYISLMGAHAEYPVNYFEKGLSILENNEADAVGGPLNQSGRTEKGKIIAACMSSRFGVGDSAFRTTKKRAYVETVAMAIYKRSIFEDIGLLDEELVRDQDDEFHYRLNDRGYRMLMEPEMEATYYVRDDFKSLWSQYFNYGLYKPLVFKKVRSGLRIRHLVPSMFVGYLLLLPLLFWLTWLAMIPLLAYFFLITFFSARVSTKVTHFILAGVAFFILHIAYGSGFLLGLRKIL